MLNCLIKRDHNLAVVFLDETTSDDEVLLAELEKIDGETKKYDIDFVKVGFIILKTETMICTGGGQRGGFRLWDHFVASARLL